MNRQEKIDKLNKRKDKKTLVTAEVTTIVNPDVAALQEMLDLKVGEFKAALGVGVEVTNLDALVDQLSGVAAISGHISDLSEAITQIPSEVKIESLDGLVKSIKEIDIKAPDVTVKATDYTNAFNRVLVALATVNQSIRENAYKPSQKADDYLPVRRVVKAGNTWQFDDTPTQVGGGVTSFQGGGGGTSVPTVQSTVTPSVSAVPVVNPDGSNISGGGGGSGDASASNQTSGAQKTQLVDAGGEAATVTGGKLDVNASVDTTGLALAATQTDKSQFTKLTDGTDTALITASGEQNVLATAQPGVDIGDVTINNASIAVTQATSSNLKAQIQGIEAHDAPITVNPLLTSMAASAAAPTDVSADGDHVRPWALRNGSQVVNLAVSGTLVTGSAGLPVAQQGTWSVTADTEFPAAGALATGAASPTTTTVGAFNFVRDTAAGNWAFVNGLTNSYDVTTGTQAAGMVAQFDDVSPSVPTENRFGAVRMSSRREVYQQIRDAAGNERGANVTAGNALVVDGSAVTQPVSAAALPLPSGAATSAKQDTLLTELQLKADLTETQPVSLASVPSHAVTNAGTFATQAAAAGDVANDGIDSGNPVKVGFHARQTNPTAVANADRVNAMSDDVGRQVVVLNQVRDLVGDQNTTITSSTAATTIVTALASTFLDLVSLTFTNISATGTEVQLLDDDGTTVRWVGYVPPTDMRGIVFQVPLTQPAVNKTWKFKTVTSVASVKITAQFVQNI